MFRMLGKEVELIRFKVLWEVDGELMHEDCVSDAHKDEIQQMLTEKDIAFTTDTIDQSENEWINGLVFETYDEALETLNVGRQTYVQKKIIAEGSNNAKLRADTDYIAIMTGVEL